MYEPTDRSAQIQRRALVVMAIGTTALFIWMIWDFLLALLMAAILSGMFHPLYRRIARRLGYRRSWAAIFTVSGVLGLLIAPVVIFLVMVADQVIELSKVARPWVEANAGRLTQLDRLFDRVPQLRVLRPYRDQILTKLGEAASELGSLSVNLVTEAARQTAMFSLMLFVALYAMYFFLKDGKVVLDKILYYVPLPPEQETRMLERFMSVSRATIKGTLIIGVIQGGLGGLAFAVAGISGAAVWGTMMAMLSAIPGLGHALVWIPVTIYLAATGQWSAAIGLFAWCAGVVGSVDNFLRPWLVGKDTELPDIVVLVSTLGGLMLFGPLGFIVGPIVAALFVTVWELYGTAFEDLLPPAPPAPASVAEFGTYPPPPMVPRRPARPTPENSKKPPEKDPK
ncbi:MAG: hypothetical protein RL685_2285 [Pseudomonadota bacterium]|jgi:predicted PurR-regulated permease PerM